VEIKYSEQKLQVDKSLAKNLLNKEEIFKKITKTKKQIFIVLMTTNGIKRSIWSDEIVDMSISLNEIID
jgi:hypothetical protein